MMVMVMMVITTLMLAGVITIRLMVMPDGDS